MHYSLKKSIKAGMMLLCMLSMLCVFSDKAMASEWIAGTGGMPVIHSFTASKTNVSLGEVFRLEWDVSNADKIKIFGLDKVNEESMPLKGNLELWPLKTTTYVLVVTRKGETVSQSVTVCVDSIGDVSIETFETSSKEVVEGTPVVLTWKTEHAKSIAIEGVSTDEVLPLSGSLEVIPATTTNYILQAEGFYGEVISKTITVNVIAKKRAVIRSFKASKTEITKGGSVTLSWEVADAQKVSIVGIKPNVATKGSIEVAPTEPTAYVLEAVGTDGVTVSQSVKVNVIPVGLPKITSFTASETEIEKGKLVTMKWTTENAKGCILLTSNGLKVTGRIANGSISVTPSTTLTFTLIAYDEDFNTDERSLIITVK
jgi:hypothetical protein